jgi:pSer/pThr/pTyr-binding forkhead associated (FHA) protein
MAESPMGPHASSPVELKERLEAERGGLSFFLYRDGRGKQHIYTLEDQPTRKIVIGRDPGADISLYWDEEVSGVHAELERVGDDWVIADDGLSRNGTFVNGERLRGRRRLKDGDASRFGETVAVFRAPAYGESRTTVLSDNEPISSTLSDTQRRVLIALCRPFKDSAPYATPATNQQIAEELYLSVDAVKTHLRVLFQKFGVEDLPQNKKRAGLVERTFQSGLISEREL